MRAFLYALLVALALLGAAGVLRASDDGVDNPQTTRTESVAPIVTNAAGVASAENHQRVNLRARVAGAIDRQAGLEYVLSDNTGSVVARISDKATHGETLSIGSAVEVRGEVNSVGGIEPVVEARHVQILASVNGPPVRDEELYSD